MSTPVIVPRTPGARPGAFEGAAELFKALANPLRLALVDELLAGPRCVHELVDALGSPQPLVSQHLRVLRNARLIRGERRGREMAYSLADEHVVHILLDAVHHAGEHPTPNP
jgi:ArsR family transcriptional regulator, zinc-responsive transcriptional repressor